MHLSQSLRGPALRLFCIGLFVTGALIGPFARASAGAVAESETSLGLVSQSSFVRPGQSFAIDVHISSPLPPGELGLRFVLYSALSNRSDFEQTLTGSEPGDELPIDTTGTFSVPSSGLGFGASTTSSMRFRVQTAASQSPTALSLDLDCATGACPGVYPLEVILVDRANDKALSSFTTHLVYLSAGSDTLPLDVALVFPLSDKLSLSANGDPRFAKEELSRLVSALRIIAGHKNARVSLGVYGELLAALSHSRSAEAKVALRELRSLVGAGEPTELLDLPFAPIDVQSLARNGLGSSVATELARSKVADRSVLHVTVPKNPYLSSSAIGGDSAALLKSDGIDEVFLPSSAISGQPNTFTTTAPIEMSNAGQSSGLLVGVEDEQLQAHESTPTNDPALAAHQFLADLAMIYFEAPFAPNQRGVVVTSNALPDPTFLDVVLGAIGKSPIARPVNASSYFDNIAPSESPVPLSSALASPPIKDAPTSTRVEQAHRELRALESVIPNDVGLLTKVNDALLLGNSSDLSASTRALYLAAPKRCLSRLGQAIELTGSKTVTLTARTETIPLTIKRSSSDLGTVDLLVRAKSGTLAFPTGSERRVMLSRNDNSERLKVTARTSGVSELDIDLVSPVGGAILSRSVLVVHSTAVSGVAIALSVAALVVLLAWWLRSLARGRRRRNAQSSATT